jgi:hypothetical protein
MASSALPAATGSSAAGRDIGRPTVAERSLVRYGIIAGPFYLVVGLAQALVRDGFDLKRHPLSVLANGSGGWVQTANFVLTGLMVIAAAVGLRRLLAPRSSAASWFLGFFGAGMLAGAIFRADPVDGFPVGTPEGMPTSVSTFGVLHFAVGGLGFLAWAISAILTGRALARRSQHALARYSVLSGVMIAAAFLGGMMLPIGILGIWLSVVAGWAWLTIVSLYLYRMPLDQGH